MEVELLSFEYWSLACAIYIVSQVAMYVHVFASYSRSLQTMPFPWQLLVSPPTISLVQDQWRIVTMSMEHGCHGMGRSLSVEQLPASKKSG